MLHTGTGSEEAGGGEASVGAVAGGVIGIIVVIGIVMSFTIGLLWWRKR